MRAIARERPVALFVFLISAGLIAFQLLLIMLFSIQFWHHSAFLVISTALLAFGASGSVIFLFSPFLKRHFSETLFTASLLLIPSFSGYLYLLQETAFNPLLLIWRAQEALALLGLAFALFVPFFSGALAIGLCLYCLAGQIHRLYAMNLWGSGLGGLIFVGASVFLPPPLILLLITLSAAAASLLVAKNNLQRSVLGVVSLGLIIFHLIVPLEPLPTNGFKDLVLLLKHPTSVKEREAFGPRGLITVVKSPSFHYLPDVSLGATFSLPGQRAIFINGDLAGAITGDGTGETDLNFLGKRTASLAYRLLREPEVLVLGAGIGTEILTARYHKAKRITSLEKNRDIAALVEDWLGPAIGGINDDQGRVVHPGDPRRFLEKPGRQYDLIQMSFFGSPGPGGSFSLRGDYLLTKEGLRAALERSKPGGILSVSRSLALPPYDGIKLLASLIEVLEETGRGPEDSLIVIRSWQSATFLARNGGFSGEEITRVKEFCRENSFDLVYYPGIDRRETNIFNIMPECYLFAAARELLSERRGEFYRTYPFNIVPATDERPFFAHFFRIGQLDWFLGDEGRLLLVYLDWSYLFLWVTFGLAVFLAGLLILGPLAFLRLPEGKTGILPALVYFACLGLAYLFLEMAFLDRFLRHLDEPAISAAVVVGSFLIYSGMGSIVAGRIPGKPGKIILLGLVLTALGIPATVFLEEQLLAASSDHSLPIRMATASLSLAPLAAPLGMFLPTGLKLLHQTREMLVPWAWGINGFFSVLGSLAAVIIAVTWGFTTVIGLALGLYILAGLSFVLSSLRR